ncbi:MAG: nucleotidyltransferase domain-containing protein [Phycisphaerae bacterium]|nr:nucleotidyltransferase domain-containing protein [Phycisphaerae bacterium]
MVAQPVIDSVRKYLAELCKAGIDAEFAVVFGSYALGEADQWSDIDLIVVAPQFDPIASREQVNRLWYAAASTDSRIEPIPCGSLRWQTDVSNAIIAEARTRGQIITAA